MARTRRRTAAAPPTAIPAMAGMGNPWVSPAVGGGVGVLVPVSGLTGSAVVMMIRVVGWWEVIVRVEVTWTVV